MTPIAPDCPGLVKLMCSFYVLLVYYHLTQVFSLTSNSLKSFETWPPFFDLLPSLRKWLKCLLLTFFGNLLHQFSWFLKSILCYSLSVCFFSVYRMVQAFAITKKKNFIWIQLFFKLHSVFPLFIQYQSSLKTCTYF